MKIETPGNFTRDEILSQPTAWQDVLLYIQTEIASLRSFFQSGRYNQVLFTGCGSTYYLSLAAASFLQTISGIPCRGIPGSELWLYPDGYVNLNQNLDQRTLLVAVSRSGATTETLRACDTFLQSGQGDLVTLSCYSDQPLAAMGSINLVFPSGQEQSIAQTRAFSSLYLAAAALGLVWDNKVELFNQLFELPSVCQQLMDETSSLAQSIARNPQKQRFYFLGAGTRYGLACELSLKMKEMSLSHSEAFHFMEFRHGPMSMVNSETVIIALVSDKNRVFEVAVLEEMRILGAQCISINRQDADVIIQSPLNEPLFNILYLPFGQLLAFERSLASGLNPDKPHNLTAVVHLGGNN